MLTAKPCRDLDVSMTTLKGQLNGDLHHIARQGRLTFPSAVFAKIDRITRSPSSAVSTIPNFPERHPSH
eukprot:767731-Hanusia_phi.AAC.3